MGIRDSFREIGEPDDLQVEVGEHVGEDLAKFTNLVGVAGGQDEAAGHGIPLVGFRRASAGRRRAPRVARP